MIVKKNCKEGQSVYTHAVEVKESLKNQYFDYISLKKIFLFLLFIFLSSFLFAQNLSIGLKDGVSWSSINGSYNFANFDNSVIEKVTGHSFGLIINYQISNHFVLATELNIDERGFDFKIDPDYNGGGYWGNYNMKYLTIPLAINYQFGNSIKYYGYTGIYMSILLKAENQTSFATSATSTLRIYDYSYDPTDEFNKYEFGGTVGIGIKIPVCKEVSFIIDTRYNFGLTKAAKNTEYNYDPNLWGRGDPNNFQNVYNRSINFSLGVLYKINNK